MRQQNVESSPGRSSSVARRDARDTGSLDPVTEFLGIGILLALLLFS